MEENAAIEKKTTLPATLSVNGRVIGTVIRADIHMVARADIRMETRSNRPLVDPALLGLAAEGMSQAAYQFSASLQACCGPLQALAESVARFGGELTALLARLKGRSLPTGTGDILYIADDAGNVQVGGYVENLEWLQGLLELRYGSALVSKVDEGPVRFFVFQKEKAWRKNSRWSLYTRIPETGDPRLWETDYYSFS